MKALRLVHAGKPARLVDVEVPEPAAGQVLIRVGGAGACHSDLHLMDWSGDQLPWPTPFTLGHENAGWIHSVGPGVNRDHVGDAVVVYGAWGCGHCRACRLGRENYCERAAEIGVGGGGLGADGGMAEYMLVPSTRFLVPLGDLDPVAAAPLADAALTPYHAIREARAKFYPGATALVIGIGGLGQMALQLIRAVTSLRAIAVDTDPAKLELARELGAVPTVRAGAGNELEAIRRATGGGANVVFDMVGDDASLALGAKALRAEGRLVIVGLARGKLPVDFFGVPYGAEITTSYWGTATELMEVVELARDRKIRMDVQRFPLAEATRAYELLRRGDIRGRAVIVP